MVAISIYKMLQKRGYQVPDDVQLIGFDDILFSWLVTPEISTIKQPIKQMGKMAVQIIISHINGEPYKENHMFEVSLLERQTTKKINQK